MDDDWLGWFYERVEGQEDFEPEEEQQQKVDQKATEAQTKIVAVLEKVKVATDRELKVRLEREYFPWVVGRGLRLLLEDGVVTKIGYPGRRRLRGSEVVSFYQTKGLEYESIRDLVKRKKDASSIRGGLVERH